MGLGGYLGDVLSRLWLSFKWLSYNPALVGLFLLVALVSAAGREYAVASVVALVSTLFAVGVAHRYADRLYADRHPEFTEVAWTVSGRMPALVGVSVVYFAVGLLAFLATYVPTLLVVARLASTYPGALADARAAVEGLPSSLQAAGGDPVALLEVAGPALLVGLVALAVVLVVVTPAVYVTTRLSLAYPAAVVDELGVVGSLRASWRVAHGNCWTILGITVAALALAVAIAAAVVAYLGFGEAVLQGDGPEVLAFTAITVGIRSVIGPAVQMAYAHLYLTDRTAA